MLESTKMGRFSKMLNLPKLFAVARQDLEPVVANELNECVPAAAGFLPLGKEGSRNVEQGASYNNRPD